MGIVVVLVAGLGLLIGLGVLPTISLITAASTSGTGTPLEYIVDLLPLCFIGLVIFGAIWTTSRMGK